MTIDVGASGESGWIPDFGFSRRRIVRRCHDYSVPGLSEAAKAIALSPGSDTNQNTPTLSNERIGQRHGNAPKFR